MRWPERFRTARLEDGEVVIRLRGKGGRYPSDQPHAGVWSRSEMYILVPSSQPDRRVVQALAMFPVLRSQSGEDAVLLIGADDVILTLISTGPSWCRARVRKAPETASHLSKHAFMAATK